MDSTGESVESEEISDREIFYSVCLTVFREQKIERGQSRENLELQRSTQSLSNIYDSAIEKIELLLADRIATQPEPQKTA